MGSRLVLLLFLLVLPAPAKAVTAVQQLDAYEALLKEYREARALRHYDFELDRMADWLGEARQYLARGDRVWLARTLRRIAAQSRYLEALAGRAREVALTDQRRHDLEKLAAQLASVNAELRKLEGHATGKVDPNAVSLEVDHTNRGPILLIEGN